MNVPTDPSIRLQILGIAVLVIISLLLLAEAAFFSARVPFLPPAGPGEWIAAPVQPNSNAIVVDREKVPVDTFTRRFQLDAAPKVARLRGRALRAARLSVNGTPLPLSTEAPASASARNWRVEFDVDVSSHLQIGENEIRVAVENVNGPALLQARLDTDAAGALLGTDARWRVLSPGLPERAAQLADDTRLNPESLLAPTPMQILRRRALDVALLFALCVGLHLGARRFLTATARARAPIATLALVVGFWLLAFWTKMSKLPVLMGFDSPGHLQYVDFLLSEHRLPLATDGWSMYHPPVFYVATALLVALTDAGRESDAGQVVYRLIPFLAGLANVFVVYRIAQRVFRERVLEICLAIATAGLLPMNVYMSAYVSNESLHGFWVSLALLFATELLLLGRRNGETETGDAGKRGFASNLGLWSGVVLSLSLAILTKFTSLLIVLVVFFFLGAKIWLADRRSLARALGTPAAGLGLIAALGGWFYVRNWIHFGQPLVGNWDLPLHNTWWEQPGFHTLDYYTRFGTSLSHPFFAGTASFWDGLYSTLWGDGLVAGMISIATRHPQWNYDFMSIAYLLALPATVCMAVGFVQLVRQSLFGRELRERFVLALHTTVLFVLGFAMLRVTLTLPYYAQVKAFYAIAGTVPIALVSASGLAALATRLRPGPRAGISARSRRIASALYFGWLGTLAAVLALSFVG